MLILGVRRWQLLVKVAMDLMKMPCISRSCHLTCVKVATKACGLAIFPPTYVERFYDNAENYHMCETSTCQSMMFLMASLVM